MINYWQEYEFCVNNAANSLISANVNGPIRKTRIAFKIGGTGGYGTIPLADGRGCCL